MAEPVPFSGGLLREPLRAGQRLSSGSNSVRQWILQQEAAGSSSSGPASLPLYTRSLPRPARASRAGWYRSQAVRAPIQDKVRDVLHIAYNKICTVKESTVSIQLKCSRGAIRGEDMDWYNAPAQIWYFK